MKESIMFLALGALSFSGSAMAHHITDVFKQYSGPQLKIAGTITTTGDITASIINGPVATFVMNSNTDTATGTATVKNVYADGTDPSTNYCILTISDPFASYPYPAVTYHSCTGNLVFSDITWTYDGSWGLIFKTPTTKK